MNEKSKKFQACDNDISKKLCIEKFKFYVFLLSTLLNKSHPSKISKRSSYRAYMMLIVIVGW